MNRHVRLFEDFDPQQPDGELWVRFIGYDEEILGAHHSKQDAQQAQYDFLEALERTQSERPFTPDEVNQATDFMKVDTNNKNQSAELVYYCKNTSVSDLEGAQQPQEILRTLIEYGINPFEESGNYEVFSGREELEEFFDGDLSWYPGGESGIKRHLAAINRRNKTRNLFGV
jgi:hypothetical protein